MGGFSFRRAALSRAVMGTVAFTFLAGLAACGRPAEQSQPLPAETAAPLTPEQITERRIADLILINNAIQAFHAERGRYPRTPDGRFLPAPADPNAEWIPELVPDYAQALPREPSPSEDGRRQYWYVGMRDGYKLIAHSVRGACGPEVEQDGIRRDPARTRPDGTCGAYGFWTDNLANH